MPKAFVLVNTELHSEADVLKELKKIEGAPMENPSGKHRDALAANPTASQLKQHALTS